MVHASANTYAQTLARLRQAIENAGNTIFVTLDQAREAAKVNLTLRPTTLVLFGNPAGGTPLMDAFPLVALDLPLKILVWEDAEGAKLGYTSMHEIARRYNIAGQEDRIAGMDRALESVCKAAST